MNLHSFSISVSFQPYISTIAPFCPLVSNLGVVNGWEFQMKSTSSKLSTSPVLAFTCILSISLNDEENFFVFEVCSTPLNK